jgi:hypothetical protein
LNPLSDWFGFQLVGAKPGNPGRKTGVFAAQLKERELGLDDVNGFAEGVALNKPMHWFPFHFTKVGMNNNDFVTKPKSHKVSEHCLGVFATGVIDENDLGVLNFGWDFVLCVVHEYN